MSNPTPSRRDFLKSSATAAMAAGLTSAISSGAHAASDETIRIGLVGCGGRGSGAAAQALSTEGPVELVAVADAFEDQARSSLEKIKKGLGANAGRVKVDDEHVFVGFDAYQKLIDSGVDLVILATPPGFRPIHFEACVNAGKHVFMEKPVAVDAPGVRQVLAAAEEAKQKSLKVGVGLQRRHQLPYIETMRRLKDGAIGDIISMRAYWNSGGVWDPRKTRQQVDSEMEYQMRNWYYYTWLCGDHIAEQHIHNLDVCNWLKDDYPVWAEGMGGREVRTDKRYGEIFDHHAVEFEYADGSRMFSYCRHIPGCWNQVDEYAHGTKGTSHISKARIEPTEGESWRFKGRATNPYQQEHDDLFAAIRENRAYSEAEYGAKSTMTAILGRMCTYSGKAIKWDDAINSDVALRPEAYAWDANPPVLPNKDGEYPVPIPGVTKVL